ncbi:EAL domain-containing protein [Geovibrio thiophilus]|uniref:EAL domain-containing protein n=1 Tax=Geovibrio thiophilus TaxID=139438 RepID=A0A3R5XYB7_9BACT|nr:bifunctional diguanylate cyclase/phosphodiesterase [Geovibrio thiophilus]QAR33730.1 EAL domain-containing protein [Geovibrio thiophilus]
MKSIKHYILASTLLTAFLVFAGVYLISSYSYNKLLLGYADKTARIMLEQTFNSLYVAMERGASREELEYIIENITKSFDNNDMSIEIHRGYAVSEMFGYVRQNEPDNLVSEAFRSGVIRTVHTSDSLTEVMPVIAEKKCLTCHDNVIEGDVMGVIKTTQNFFFLQDKTARNIRLLLMFILPVPLLIGVIISFFVSRRLKLMLEKLHSSISNINSVEDLKSISLQRSDFSLMEVAAINEEIEELAGRLRSIATDNDTLQFQIRLMERLVITAEAITDWVDYTKKLLRSVNSVVYCQALFAVFKTDDTYEFFIFWNHNPDTETKMAFEEAVYEIPMLKTIFSENPPSIKHYVAEIGKDMIRMSKEEITAQLKNITFPERRIGNITGIGIQTPFNEDKSKSIVVDSILTTLMNVVGSVKAIHLYTKDVEFFATRDPLTNLHNQRMFWDLLKAETKRAERHKSWFSLVVLDFDNFKLINDVYGHAFGDKLLQRFAEKLKSTSREEDIVARYGGDEFTLILPEADEENAYTVVQRIKENLDAVNVLAPDGKNIKATTSIGIASYPFHADEDKKLFLVASNMMYKAKREGKNRICAPTGEDIINSLKEMGVKNQIILNAIENKSLIPYFQPIMSLTDNRVSVHELLMRIPVNGRIMPAAEFIDDAEAMGVMHRMDLMLMEKAFAEIRKAGYEGFLFINLSPKSLMMVEFEAQILALVETYGINKSKIVFEITERETVKNISLLAHFITKLKNEGFLFAIDDFGSGFSSFHYIKNFPIDFIKIEGDFIRNIINDDVDKAFVKSALTLAGELRIRTVAEYVENSAVLESLKELGVDYAQGYFIDKPAPALLDNNICKTFLTSADTE